MLIRSTSQVGLWCWPQAAWAWAFAWVLYLHGLLLKNTTESPPRDTRQGIISLWNDKSVLAEELNVKYFNKGSFQKIQASTCGFVSSVLGKEERVKSCGNLSSFTCCPCKKPVWVCTGTEHYYSLVLEHVFRGSPGPMQPFCQTQSCPIAILPTTWHCWPYQDAYKSYISPIPSTENWTASLVFPFLP